MIYANPAAAVKRAQLRSKEIVLPSSEKFNAMVEEMRNGHGRFSRDCADFVEGLAYSGMRKGEANALEWRDLDFDANEIVVRGDAVTGTKGGEGWRRVPMITDARTLFERLRSEPTNHLIPKCSRSANVRRRLIGQLRKAAWIASFTMICATCLQRSASKAASTFRRSADG